MAPGFRVSLREPGMTACGAEFMSDARTYSFYDAEAAAYAARSRISPYLNDFIAELPPRY